MKSIEELLEIIKGVDMDLWDNVEQEAYDEILSRFAEKDKRIAELEKLPQIKYIYGLITKIAELEKQIDEVTELVCTIAPVM